MPTGEVGQIFCRSATLFDGYTSGKTKDFHDGFMASGDMGYVDENGRLFVVGRDDEMIVSGGENVYPIEVEKTLASHADVAEAAVHRGGRRAVRSAAGRIRRAERGRGGHTRHAEAARPRQPGELQSAAADHGARRTPAQHHRQDRRARTCRHWSTMGKRRPAAARRPRAGQRRQRRAAVRPRRLSHHPGVLRSAGRPPRWRRCTWRARCSARCGGGCAATTQPAAGESPCCSR